jgi:hypothetical protein
MRFQGLNLIVFFPALSFASFFLNSCSQTAAPSARTCLFVYRQAELIARLMENPNADWTEVISAAQADVSVLQQIDVVERLDNVLKINIKACQSIKHDFQLQLQNIYMDMLLV